MAGDKVADRGISLFPSLLGGPFTDRVALLPEGKGDPRDIGRETRDLHPGRGNAEQERHLGLDGQRRDRGGGRRQHDAHKELNMIARDQLLREPFADLGAGSVVALDQLKLDALRQILLVQLQVKIDRLLRLIGGLRDKTGVAVDQPDLDDRFCRR
jgi:hypothetical protein